MMVDNLPLVAGKELIIVQNHEAVLPVGFELPPGQGVACEHEDIPATLSGPRAMKTELS